MLVLDSSNPYYYKVFRDDQDFYELVIFTEMELTKPIFLGCLKCIGKIWNWSQ